jgi:alpha-methylacyl-CoA racemase
LEPSISGTSESGRGALTGTRIIEFAGVGPAPFAGMMLADHGAEVICIKRFVSAYPGDPSKDVLNRSRRSLALNLKNPDAVDVVKEIACSCDALIEGFRPGVMERLGLGPDSLLTLNPRLVYGRMTGWGQTGPMRPLAGHDINYISLSGVLHSCSREGQKPTPPVNMLGDFGGGGMLLAFGIVAGILSARSTGRGQVIDAAMTDGSALFTSMMCGMRAQGRWHGPPGTNLLDPGAPFYDTYETADGEFIAIGAIEPEFYAEMRRVLGLTDDAEFEHQLAEARWPLLKEKMTQLIKTRSRAEWCKAFEGSDACFSPVLALDAAARHPHNSARTTFIEIDGVLQPAPAPRFMHSGTVTPTMPRSDGPDDAAVLKSVGYDDGRIWRLRQSGALKSQ